MALTNLHRKTAPCREPKINFAKKIIPRAIREGERKMSTRAKELKIDIQTMTITVPVGNNLVMVLVDPKQGKAKLVPLVEHGETVVKSSQGKIAKVDYRESELF